MSDQLRAAGSDVDQRIAAIEADLAAISAAPWKACGCGKCGLVWSLPADVVVASAQSAKEQDGEGPTEEYRQRNAQFIALAPDRLAWLLATLRETRAQLATETGERVSLEKCLSEEIGEMNIRDGKHRAIAYTFLPGDTRKLSPRQRAIMGLRPDPDAERMLSKARDDR